jgi:hypothetical protein
VNALLFHVPTWHDEELPDDSDLRMDQVAVDVLREEQLWQLIAAACVADDSLSCGRAKSTAAEFNPLKPFICN